MRYYYNFKGSLKIKSLSTFIIFMVILISLNVNLINAQTLTIGNSHQTSHQTSHKTYSIEDLAVYDFKQKDQSNFVSWVNFYNTYKDGMATLQREIVNHSELYPMQDLEDVNKKESDDFRRWEYQMRKMQAEIVSPKNNLLEVHFISKNKITFCSDQSFELKINIKNISGTNLPMFYFFLKIPPGIILNQNNMKLPKSVSFIKNSNVFVFSKGLHKDKSKNIQLIFNVGCDGHGGSPVLKGKLAINEIINWKLVLIGYLLDYQNKKLYKVIDFGKFPKDIILTKT